MCTLRWPAFKISDFSAEAFSPVSSWIHMEIGAALLQHLLKEEELKGILHYLGHRK